MEEVMTIKETARYLKISPSTVYRMANRKLLPGFKLGADAGKTGGDWRFVRSALDAWLIEKVAMAQRDAVAAARREA